MSLTHVFIHDMGCPVIDMSTHVNDMGSHVIEGIYKGLMGDTLGCLGLVCRLSGAPRTIYVPQQVKLGITMERDGAGAARVHPNSSQQIKWFFQAYPARPRCPQGSPNDMGSYVSDTGAHVRGFFPLIDTWAPMSLTRAPTSFGKH